MLPPFLYMPYPYGAKMRSLHDEFLQHYELRILIYGNISKIYEERMLMTLAVYVLSFLCVLVVY